MTIDLNQVSNELLDFTDETDTFVSDNINVVETYARSNESLNETDEDENPLGVHRTASNETIVTSKFSVEIDEHTVSIAPGEGRKPLSIFEDENCKETAFPHLLPTGKFGYKVKRDIHITPVKYFNQRLLNYTQNFASDTANIFFANPNFIE